MHLLPPVVTTHHQNVAFLVLFVVLVQSISDVSPFDDPHSSSDQSSSDGGRRRPLQHSRITKAKSVRTRSGPLLLLEPPIEMNDNNDSEKEKIEAKIEEDVTRSMPARTRSSPQSTNHWKHLFSFNNSGGSPSLEAGTSKSYNNKKRMRILDEKRITKAKQIEKLLSDNLMQIQKNIRRPNSLKENFKRLLSFKSKNNEKKQSDLNYIPENACEHLLPNYDPSNGKLYNDFELRIKACRKLHALTGWVAVKEAISGMENSPKLNRCPTINEGDYDDDGNGIESPATRSFPRYGSVPMQLNLPQMPLYANLFCYCGVQRRSSSPRNTGMTRSLSVGAELLDSKVDEECIFTEPIICTIQWDVLRTGMLRVHNNLKENILAKCRRVNNGLQLLILQNLLLKTRPSRRSNESFEERGEKLKIGENLLAYKNNFLKERTELFKMLDSSTTNNEEFNKALAELRDKVVAHWTWLYEQHLC